MFCVCPCLLLAIVEYFCEVVAFAMYDINLLSFTLFKRNIFNSGTKIWHNMWCLVTVGFARKWIRIRNTYIFDSLLENMHYWSLLYSVHFETCVRMYLFFSFWIMEFILCDRYNFVNECLSSMHWTFGQKKFQP